MTFSIKCEYCRIFNHIISTAQRRACPSVRINFFQCFSGLPLKIMQPIDNGAGVITLPFIYHNHFHTTYYTTREQMENELVRFFEGDDAL